MVQDSQTPNQQSGNVGASAPTVLLMRHATTALNEQHRIRAWADVDIDPGRGRDDTLKTAQLLQGIPVSEIVTSDLTRAEQTSQIIGNQIFAPISQDRNLRPWDLGKFMGLKFDEVKSELAQYVEHPNKVVPGGEPFNSFLDRWKQGLASLVARAQESPTGVVLGVTHSRNVEAVRWMMTGGKDTKSLVEAKTVPPSGIMALQVQGGKLTEVPFDNEHLTKEE